MGYKCCGAVCRKYEGRGIRTDDIPNRYDTNNDYGSWSSHAMGFDNRYGPGSEKSPFYSLLKKMRIAGENGKDEMGTFAPWLKDNFSGKSRKNILKIGGTYFLLDMPGALSGDKDKKRQEYTGLRLVYGDTIGYTKPFSKEFERFVGADFDNGSKDKHDARMDFEEANRRAVTAAAHGMAMQAAGMRN